MIELLLVGAGGFIGSTFRYVLMQLFSNIASNSSFPWGIFIANISGSLLNERLKSISSGSEFDFPNLKIIIKYLL